MILRERAALLVSALFVGCAAATASRQGPVAIPLAPPPRPVPELVEQLGAPDAPSRAAAAWALAGAGEVDEATSEALSSRLEDPSEPVREAATWALSHVRGSGDAKGNLMDAPPKLLVQTRPRYPIDAFRRACTAPSS